VAAVPVRTPTFILLVLLTLSAGASAGIEPSSAPDPSAIIDDDAIVARIETEGSALLKGGKVIRLKALRTQLPRVKSCTLDLPPSDLTNLNPAELFARRANAVLVVAVLGKTKKRPKYEMAGCTGFALTADGVFVTNYHVVDSSEGEALVVMTREGQVTPVSEVLAADKLSDVAIVRAAGAVFSPVPLAPQPPLPGAPIWVISHPDHNFFSLTAGIVSRYFVAATDAGRTPQMAVTADFGAGSSGGPILDVHGDVTGIVCSTTSVYWQDEKAKINDLQMVFKHCVPVSSIRKLIESKKE
jgi:serine protease Do